MFRMINIWKEGEVNEEMMEMTQENFARKEKNVQNVNEEDEKTKSTSTTSSSCHSISSPKKRGVVINAVPKRSEPIMRKLWTLAHRVVEPRTLGYVAQYSSAFKESVFCYDLKKYRQIALTIDDAPSEPELMEETLEILQRFGIKATFFVVESFAQKERERFDILKQCIAQGHELGNHMIEDKSCVSMSRSEFLNALLQCERLIEQCDPGFEKRRRKWFRPPHGYMNANMSKILRNWHYVAALADVFPLDTEVRSIDWIVDFVLNQTKPGSIILLHAPDIRKTKSKTHKRQNNLAVLAKLIPQLLQLGFTIGTLSDLADAADAENRAKINQLKNDKTKKLHRSASFDLTTLSYPCQNDNHLITASSVSSSDDDENKVTAQQPQSTTNQQALQYAASL